MPRGHRILNSVACVNHGTSSLSAQPPVFASPFLLSLSSLLQANDLPSPPPNVVPDLLGDNVRQSASTLPTPFASGRASSLAPRVQVTAAFALGPIGNALNRRWFPQRHRSGLPHSHFHPIYLGVNGSWAWARATLLSYPGYIHASQPTVTSTRSGPSRQQRRFRVGDANRSHDRFRSS